MVDQQTLTPPSVSQVPWILLFWGELFFGLVGSLRRRAGWSAAVQGIPPAMIKDQLRRVYETQPSGSSHCWKTGFIVQRPSLTLTTDTDQKSSAFSISPPSGSLSTLTGLYRPCRTSVLRFLAAAHCASANGELPKRHQAAT